MAERAAGGPGGEAPRSAEDVAADVFDFRESFLTDEERGVRRPLAEYLSRFPGSEDAVAAEYVELTRGRGDATDPDSPDPDVPGKGERRLGKYVLERPLGRGGQGEVWLARDPDLQRTVAIKVQTALFVTEEQRLRFRREAESIARLDHPGVAQVHEADLDASPAYIAMRYVEGEDLGASLAAARAGDGDLPWIPSKRRDLVRVLRFFERCARALHAAHEAGVVHRDVKPGNVMVTPDGDPVLLDFGLAREARGDADVALTREGDVFGTLAYMAPEQLGGDTRGLSPRTDVYGLGVTLFEALTGERPFRGNSPAEVAIAVDRGDRPDARELNRAIDEDTAVVLATALERAPERRYATALDLAEDLRRIAEYEPIRARPAPPHLRLRRWCRREPAWAATLGVTLFALALGLVLTQGALRRMHTLLGKRFAQEAIDHVPDLVGKAPAGAVAYALSALELEDSWNARSALVDPLFQLTLERKFLLQDGGRPADVAFTADGEAVVVAGPGSTVTLFRRDGEDAAATADVGAAATCVVCATEDRVAVGTEDGRVLLLAVDGLTRAGELPVGDGAVLDLHAGPGLLAATLAGAVAAIDPDAARVVGRFDADHGGYHGARVARDGDDVLVVARATRGVVVLRGPGLEVAFESVRETRETRGLAVAAEAPLAALVSSDGGVELIELDRMAVLPHTRDDLGAEGLEGASVALSPDGSRLAVGYDRGVRAATRAGTGGAQGDRWSARESDDTSCLRIRDLVVHESEGVRFVVGGAVRAPAAGPRVVDVSFSPDGTRVAVADWTDRVAVFDARTGALRAEHRDWNRPDVVRWAPSGGVLASIGIGKSVEVWRDRPLAEAFRFEPIAHGAVGPDADVVHCAFLGAAESPRVVLCDAGGRAGLFAAPPLGGGEARHGPRPGALLARLDPAEFHGTTGASSPGGARLAVASAAGRVAWLGRGGRLRVTGADGALVRDVFIGGFEGGPRALALSPDGRAFAAVDGGGRVFALGLANRERIDAGEALVPGARGELVAFSVPGDALFVAGPEGAVHRHPLGPYLEVGAPVRLSTPDGWRAGTPLDLVVAPDGSEVIAAWRGATSPIGWDPGSGDVVRSGGGRRLRRYLFAGADGLLASAARGPGTIEVLRGDRALPALDLVIEGQLEGIAACSAGRVGAVAVSDGRVVVWDLESGAPLLAPRVHPGGARCVAVDGVGRDARILSAGAGGAALWPVDAVELARRVAPRGTNLYERRILGDAEAFFSR